MPKRVDNNQKEIVTQLRQLGYSVSHTHTIGSGFPDIVVGQEGKNYLFEIKNYNQPPSKRILTQDEQKFHSSWSGQVSIIHTAQEAVNIINYEAK